MLNERQELILKLIVEEYVRTAEPVGSRSLSAFIDVLTFAVKSVKNRHNGQT